MTTCLVKSCAFVLLCVSVVNVFNLCVCVFPFWFRGCNMAMDCIPDYFLPIYIVMLLFLLVLRVGCGI